MQPGWGLGRRLMDLAMFLVGAQHAVCLRDALIATGSLAKHTIENRSSIQLYVNKVL